MATAPVDPVSWCSARYVGGKYGDADVTGVGGGRGVRIGGRDDEAVDGWQGAYRCESDPSEGIGICDDEGVARGGDGAVEVACPLRIVDR